MRKRNVQLNSSKSPIERLCCRCQWELVNLPWTSDGSCHHYWPIRLSRLGYNGFAVRVLGMLLAFVTCQGALERHVVRGSTLEDSKRRTVSLHNIQKRMILGDNVPSAMYEFVVRITITFSNKSSYSKKYDDACPNLFSKKYRKKHFHPKEPGLMCDGAIVSKRHVLTAARCIWPKEMRPVYTVYYGATDAKDQKSMEVTAAFRHPKCKSFDHGRSFVDDIALLETAVPFPDDIDIAALPKNLGNLTGRVVDSAGWGNVDEQHTKRMNHSKTLKHVSLRLRSLERCKKAYPRSDLTGQLCATSKVGQPHLDDFGAPLLHTKDDWYVIGVFSWFSFKDFPTSPFVFESTEYHKEWIKSVIEKPREEDHPEDYPDDEAR